MERSAKDEGLRDWGLGTREQGTAIWRGGGRGAGLVKAMAYFGTNSASLGVPITQKPELIQFPFAKGSVL